MTKKFTPGQSVMMTRSYGKPFPALVAKVGRKYAYIGTGSMQDQVDAETGAQKNGFGRAFTLEEWSERERSTKLHAELRAHGIGPVGSGRFTQSLETLEQILAVLQAPTEHTEGEAP
jgi:hypothetical protein